MNNLFSLSSSLPKKDTCVGFLLGGVGEINKNRHPNFMVVDKSMFNIDFYFKLLLTNVNHLYRHCGQRN